MLSDLEDLVDEVLDKNTKRVKYFCGMTKKLKLIEVYDDILDFYGEDDEEDEAYEALEKLRVHWRNQEISRIKANLEQTQYRLQGPEAVAIITNGRRMEQVSIVVFSFLAT